MRHSSMSNKLFITRLIAIIGLYLWISWIFGPGVRLALEWGGLYKISDFNTISDLFLFWHESRSGVSPLLATLEVINYLLMGDTYIMQFWFYKFCIWGSFSCVILLFGNSYFVLLLSSVISYFLSYCLVNIAQFSTFPYDVFLPFAILASICLLFLAFNTTSNKKYNIYIFLSGLILGACELSRPFVIFLIPIFLFYVFKHFKSKSSKIIFITGLAILSGSWHTKLLIFNDSQFLWSNYGGRNLIGAWIEKPTPEVCSASQVKDLYSQNEMRIIYNHPCFSKKSKAAMHGVIAYAIENPIYAFKNTTRLLKSFFEPRFERVLYKNPTCAPYCLLLTDDHTKLSELSRALYILLVWIFAFSLICILIINIRSMLLRNSINRVVNSNFPQNLIFLCLLVLVPLLALGEDGEQVRFLKSIMPILACTPFILRNQLIFLTSQNYSKAPKES